MADWFYSQGGQQLGPVDIASLQQLAASGQLKPGDLVWTQGMPAWQPSAQVAGIFQTGPTPPPILATPIGYATPTPYVPGPSLGDNAGARWLLPVGRSGWAIAAGYLGLLSFLVVPGPFAIICSIIAIRDIRKHPDRHGMGRAIFGLVTGIILPIAMCVLVAATVYR
jgi:hypothetical protein